MDAVGEGTRAIGKEVLRADLNEALTHLVRHVRLRRTFLFGLVAPPLIRHDRWFPSRRSLSGSNDILGRWLFLGHLSLLALAQTRDKALDRTFQILIREVI